MARTKSTIEDCQVALSRLQRVVGDENLKLAEDGTKVRLYTVDNGVPVFLGSKSVSPSTFVQSADFTADLLAFLGDDDDDDTASES